MNSEKYMVLRLAIEGAKALHPEDQKKVWAGIAQIAGPNAEITTQAYATIASIRLAEEMQATFFDLIEKTISEQSNKGVDKLSTSNH